LYHPSMISIVGLFFIFLHICIYIFLHIFAYIKIPLLPYFPFAVQKVQKLNFQRDLSCGATVL